MNNTRKHRSFLLPLILCAALILSILPPKTEVQAAGQIVLTATQIGSPLYGINRIPFGSRIVIDTGSMTATASFFYGEAEVIDDAYIERNQILADKLYNNQSTTVSYRVEECDDGTNKYHLVSTSSAEGFMFNSDRYSMHKDDFEKQNYYWEPWLAFAHYLSIHCNYRLNVLGSPGSEKDEDFELLVYYPEELYVRLNEAEGTGVVNVDYPHSVAAFAVNIDDEPVKKREYAIGTDNFGFNNNDSSFYTDSATIAPKIYRGKTFDNGTYGAMIDESAYDSMMLGRSPSQMAGINKDLSSRFEGACYGMSIVSGLIYEDKIALNQVGNADKTYNLAKPVENPALLRTLAFYQINTSYDLMSYETRHGQPYSPAQTLKIVESLKEHPENPVVIVFTYNDPDTYSKKKYGHAVLAYKVENAKDIYDYAYKYDISVYDPNDHEKAGHLLVSSSGECDFENTRYGSNPAIRTGDLAKDLYDITLKYPEVKKGEAIATTNGGITVESDGKTSTVAGNEVTGDLEAQAYSVFDGSDTQVSFDHDNTKKIRFKRNGGTNASLQTDNTYVLIKDGAKEATINPDGSVEAKTDGNKGSLSVASDTEKGKLFGITVTSGAGNISVVPTKDGAKVTTDNGTSDITVSGKTDSATFGGIDTSGGVDIKTDGNKISISDGEKEIARGTADQNGGTTIKIGDAGWDDPGEDPGDDPGDDPDIERPRSGISPVPSINDETIYLVKGQSYTIPGSKKGWTTENKAICKVTTDGKITAAGTGTAHLTSSSGDKYTVNVILPEIDKKNLNLVCGDKTDLLVSRQLNGTDLSSYYPVSWFSNNPSVAKVVHTNMGCEVTAVSPGSARIDAYVNGKTYPCTVKVTETKKAVIDSEETYLTLMPMQSITLKLKGKSFANRTWEGLTPEVKGKKTDYYNDVVYITSAGKLTAIGKGTTTLKCDNGVTIHVTVNEPSERTVYLNTGKTKGLKFAGVTSKKATWSCADGSGIIDKKALESGGMIKALKTGEVTVKCEYKPFGDKSEGFTYETKVYVENVALVTDDKLTKTNQYSYLLNMTGGESGSIRFDKTEDYGIYQPVMFKSSNPAAAYVDENGNLYTSEVAKKTVVNLTCPVNGKATKVKLTLLPAPSDTTVPTVADNDITHFDPPGWSWVAEGEGYGRKIFTSGKYVREDGQAVLYIDSSDSPDGFSYQLFAMAQGSKQSNFTATDYTYGNSFVWASCPKTQDNAEDISNGLKFHSDGKGTVTVTSDWIDEMVYQYGSADGTYRLVREKK